MSTCETCGNQHAKCLEIIENGKSHFYDSVECAIQALEPICEQCQCQISGHELDANEVVKYCDFCKQTLGGIGFIGSTYDTHIERENRYVRNA